MMIDFMQAIIEFFNDCTTNIANVLTPLGLAALLLIIVFHFVYYIVDRIKELWRYLKRKQRHLHRK